MKRKITAIIISLLLSMMLFVTACQEEQKSQSSIVKKHAAVTAVPRTDKATVRWWEQRQKQVNERLKKGHIDLLFIGDSITHGWESQGRDIWRQYYAPRKSLNMGFSGDRTENVLWRLDHSNLKKISPKLAVIMIGTNNSNGNDYTAEQIADGIIAVCERLRERLPKTKILLLAIFPRNETPSAQREKNAKASLLASKIADGKMIYYLDINSNFLTKDGMLTKDIMPDYLHPNKAGYKIWAEAIEPKVAELMGEKK
jgi:beta-glucosidase